MNVLSWNKMYEPDHLKPYQYRPTIKIHLGPDEKAWILQSGGFVRLQITETNLYDGDYWARVYPIQGDWVLAILRAVWEGYPQSNGLATVIPTPASEMNGYIKDYYGLVAQPQRA